MEKTSSGRNVAMARRCVVSGTLACVLLLSGCASTGWQDAGSYYRSTQTLVRIKGAPGAEVHVDNRHVGRTPLDLPLQYEERVQRRTRKVSYWETQPGWSLFLTITSLGLYVPFSLIPVDTQTTVEPTGSFRNNGFAISVSSPGFNEWRTKLRLEGEKETKLEPSLRKGGEQ